MSIASEAEEFKAKKRIHFLSRLDMLAQELELFVTQSLYDSASRDNALTKLQEVRLWAKHCSDSHGLK
jgi:hypothetical protein